MKASPLLVAPVVRVVAILSLLSAMAAPPAQSQVSFLQPLTFDVGQGGGSGVYADFNRDGKLDIAFAGSVLLGNGDGTFKAPINLGVTGDLVATADFNGDGNPDLLVASTSSTVLNILLGNGDGTFTYAHAYVGSGGILIADFNSSNNGNLDLAIGQTMLLGNGNGTFNAQPVVPLPGGYVGASSDFNGDGYPDLAVPSFSASDVYILLGDGLGSLAMNSRYQATRLRPAI